MKKIIPILLCLILLCGCNNKKVPIRQVVPTTDNDNKEIVLEKEPEYTDNNNTPIGIYKLNGNTLTRLDTINITPVVEKDIDIFQIFPSNEEKITLNNSFGKSFYDEWSKYNTNNNLKIGFNIKFTLNNGNKIDYNIFSPEETFNHWEHLMNYLYDDYANLGKSFYSHIENDEVNEGTLYTAFKMQSSYQCDEIASEIKLTVFTYDSEDDFINNEYRGNSTSSLLICINGKECKKDTSS